MSGAMGSDANVQLRATTATCPSSAGDHSCVWNAYSSVDTALSDHATLSAVSNPCSLVDQVSPSTEDVSANLKYAHLKTVPANPAHFWNFMSDALRDGSNLGDAYMKWTEKGGLELNVLGRQFDQRDFLATGWDWWLKFGRADLQLDRPAALSHMPSLTKSGMRMPPAQRGHVCHSGYSG